MKNCRERRGRRGRRSRMRRRRRRNVAYIWAYGRLRRRSGLRRTSGHTVMLLVMVLVVLLV
ncbi:hypothetical protein N9L68_04190 [bacterium]|nr:hypothetical protein [bacterium]